MTPTEIDLVQRSFRQFAPVSDQVAGLFFARLFELDPAVRSLFGGNAQELGRTFMSMIGWSVSALDDLDSLLPSLRALGARHAGYGVLEEHYASVGAALIWTLQKGLGLSFTPDVREAWTAAYSLLARTMIEGQRSARVAA